MLNLSLATDDYILSENDMHIKQCNHVVLAIGQHIKNLNNTHLRAPMHLVMNAYTVSLFTTYSPDSLLVSIDMLDIADILSI